MSFFENVLLAFWIASYFICLSSISAKYCPKECGLNAFWKSQPASPGVYSLFPNNFFFFLFCILLPAKPSSQISAPFESHLAFPLPGSSASSR